MLILGAEKQGFRQLKDRTYSINLNTQELTPTELAELGSLPDFFYVAFKPEHFVEEEQELLEKIKADPFNGFEELSQSQKLRRVLYVYWLQLDENNQTADPSEVFYRKEMNKIIQHYKNKIV